MLGSRRREPNLRGHPVSGDLGLRPAGWPRSAPPPPAAPPARTSRRRGPIIADSARPETISYMQRQGFGSITGSIKGAGSMQDGVEFLKAHDILVHPRCRHLIDELALYSYRTHPKTGAILSELEDCENHAVEGLRRGGYDSSMKWV
ncbi:terminase large subunit [Inquilinus sp. NPDC058860]|uniref:terminase large subunit n=1 Tax=Inquilinus sp. NPDC058860 TaxID=3346652 RepID=UPI0036C531A0